MQKFIIVVAVLVLATASGCAGNSDARFAAISQNMATEQNTHAAADAEQERDIELTHAKAANLETEVKRLRKVVCKYHPEDCPASVLDK